MNINIQENKVNDKFRNDVLSSMIRVSSDMHILQIIEEIFKLEWDEVLRSKEAYIKTLREIGVYDEKSQKEIEAFFEAFKSAFIRFLHKGNYGIWWSNKRSGGESRKYMARYYERIFVI